MRLLGADNLRVLLLIAAAVPPALALVVRGADVRRREADLSAGRWGSAITGTLGASLHERTDDGDAYSHLQPHDRARDPLGRF